MAPPNPYFIYIELFKADGATRPNQNEIARVFKNLIGMMSTQGMDAYWIQQNLTRMRTIFGDAEAVEESLNVVNGALSA